MSSIDTLATFFGWCIVINVVLLLGLLVRGIILRNLAVWTFDVSTEEVKAAYLNAFIQYRSAILLLNVAPYIALKIMG